MFQKTKWVTNDKMTEEEKEQDLCQHSERIAMNFAILNTQEGTPLVLWKNLRVCGDCHNVTKFYSQESGRKISVRDASRWHHFKDGKCSCGDYW